ncbi:hypothetical protein [Flagellimonas myxillae]|uniref:hypothetical protein n=1 Tax=Flagellimonas myxillae TaxID=2942214 RepID=UPI00201FADBB|nr:hypothetical protein [Muricauda myxillae]MCL6264934.1 hypothetical protein [Muricauda myxillae]
MEELKKKDFWDIAKIIGGVINLVLLGTITIFLNSLTKERELDAKYVQLASEIILSNDSNNSNIQLKKWALNILDEKSPVPMPPKLKADILNIELNGYYSTGAGFGGENIEFNTFPESNLYVLIDNKPVLITPHKLRLRQGTHNIEYQNELGITIAKEQLSIVDSTMYKVDLNFERKHIAIKTSPYKIDEHKLSNGSY